MAAGGVAAEAAEEEEELVVECAAEEEAEEPPEVAEVAEAEGSRYSTVRDWRRRRRSKLRTNWRTSSTIANAA